MQTIHVSEMSDEALQSAIISTMRQIETSFDAMQVTYWRGRHNEYVAEYQRRETERRAAESDETECTCSPDPNRAGMACPACAAVARNNPVEF